MVKLIWRMVPILGFSGSAVTLWPGTVADDRLAGNGLGKLKNGPVDEITLL